jgi:hypothetical protein
MAGFTFSIGSYTFLSLSGEIQPYRQELDVMNLPYRDGDCLRRRGQHGRPFTLQSCVDLSSETAALDKFEEYRAYIGAGVQTLTYRSVDMSSALTNDYKVHVLDVASCRIVKAKNMVGGLNVSDGSAGVMLYADWTMLLVPF